MYLPSVADLKAGAKIWDNRTYLLAFYEGLRQGELFRLMLMPKTEANGLDIIENLGDWVYINYFRRLTRFIVNATFNEYPKAYNYKFWQAWEDAVRYESSQGLGIVGTEPGNIFAVQPMHYRRLADAQVLIYPRSTKGSPMADIVDLHILHDSGSSEGRTYKVNGDNLGNFTEGFPTKLTGIFKFGDGASDYADLTDLTREIIRRVSLHSRSLNRNSSPHLAVPESTLAAMQTHGKDFKYDPSGMLFPIPPDTPPPKWIVHDPFSTAVHSQLQFLTNEWHEAAQIPKSPLSQGKAPSGAALGIQLAGITWRVKRIQRDIEALLPEVSTAMGIPLGGCRVCG